MFHTHFATVTAALALLLAPLPASAADGTCEHLADVKPYVAEFFQLEEPQLGNLVANFNIAEPRTDLHPQVVGYTWKMGWDLVQLYMFENDCLVIDKPYPRLKIWAMMKSFPAAAPFDKSAATYAAQVEAHLAKEDANFERGRKWRAESGLDVADEETGMPLNDQANDEGYGELD